MKTFLGNIFLRLLLTDLLKISRKPARRWNFIMSFIIRSIEAKSGVDNNMQISCFFPSLSLSASPFPSLFPIYRYITATVFQILTEECTRRAQGKKFKWTVETAGLPTGKSSREKRKERGAASRE